MLPREFYLKTAEQVAPELLGKLLVHETAEGKTAGMIVEVEAYDGTRDKGAHSYPYKRTARTEIQFGPGGYAYIYQIYGMHTCFNVVTGGPEQPQAVLVRALEPVEGLELMEKRRGTARKWDLCDGPGKLSKAMGITKAQYGLDLLGGELYLEPFREIDPADILVSPRINIDYAEECRDYLWRFFLKGNPFVSKVPGRYESKAYRI